MTDYNITGLVPAQTGGAWENGDSWFLLDKSGSFSVNKELLCTIYVVGRGKQGGSGWSRGVYQTVNGTERYTGYFYGGKGGDGGKICVFRNIKIPENENCVISLGGDDSELHIGDISYASGQNGYTQATGGAGAYRVINNNGYSTEYSPHKLGENGVLTPYGYVGSSGGGGSAGNGEASYASGGEGSDTNYGGGGHGSESPTSAGSSIKFTYNYSDGQPGCVIICVQDELVINDDDIETPISPDLTYNGLAQFPFGENGVGGVTITGDLSGVTAGDYTSIFTINDNKCWKDGTREPKTVKWKIKPLVVPKPELSQYDYDYNGSAIYNNSLYKLPSIIWNCDNPDVVRTNIMSTGGTGTNKQYKAGEYSVVFSLNDEGSCSWSDDTAEDFELTWRINPVTVKIPLITSEDYTYDGYAHSAIVDGYNADFMMQSGGYGAYTNVGNYTIVYNLRDPDSCTWVGGTVTQKSVEWKIVKQIVFLDKPYLEDEQKSFVYDGTQHTPVITDYKQGYMTISGTTSSISANNAENPTWDITIKLNTFANYLYLWKDEPEENWASDIVLKWTVTKNTFKVPRILSVHKDFTNTTHYVHTEELSSYDYENTTYRYMDGYNINVMRHSGSTSGKTAGEYGVNFELKDPDSASWEDTTTETKTVYWYIDKISVNKPEVTDTEKIVKWYLRSGYIALYTQSPTIENYDKNIISVSGNSASYSGNYTLTFSLNDKVSSEWVDGTTDDKTVDWKIKKEVREFTKPTLLFEETDYNGTLKTNTLNNYVSFYNHTVMSSDVPLTGTAAGTYSGTVQLDLNDGVFDFRWDDGTNDPMPLSWEIKKKAFDKPEFTEFSFEYDGLNHSPVESGFDDNVMERHKNSIFIASSVGFYYVIYSLKDKESATWGDGTTDDFSLMWKISGNGTVSVPFVYPLEFEYNGKRQNPVIGEYDANIIAVSGTTYAVDADEYSIRFSLIDNDSITWSDGTTNDKIVKWYINKKMLKIKKPYIDEGKGIYTYNGVTTYNVLYDTTNYDSTYMSVTDGISSSRTAGNFDFEISLKTHNNYEYQWEDSSSGTITLNWTVDKITVKKPYLSQDVFLYKGYSDNYYGWQQPRLFGYDPNIMIGTGIREGYTSGSGYFYFTKDVWYGTSQWKIDSYYITVEFKDPDSCTWEESGANAKLDFQWSIIREIVYLPKPYLETNTFEYDGTEKTPYIVNGDNEGIIYSKDSTLSAVAVNNYIIHVSLQAITSDKVTKDYRWENSDDTEDKSEFDLYWYIVKGTAEIPTISPVTFLYDGTPHIPIISGLDENKISVTGYEKKTAADTYTVTFTLKDPDSCTWADNTVKPKELSWVIKKSTAKIPRMEPTKLEYDGLPHSVTFTPDDDGHSFVLYGFDPYTMSCGSYSVTDVGKYEAVVSLKDPVSCMWSDNTISPKKYEFEITKRTVLYDKPYLAPTAFDFNGEYQSPDIIYNPDGEKENVKPVGVVIGEESVLGETKTGKYRIIFHLKEDPNSTYLWGDSIQNAVDGDVELEWEIRGKYDIPKPDVTGIEFVYDKTEHSPNISEYYKDYIAQSGTAKATEAEKYKIVFSLKYPESTSWADGSKEDIIFEWEINKREIKKPIVTNTEFVYDTMEHSPDISNFDEAYVLISGEKATNAEDYEIIFSLWNKKSTYWTGGSTDDIIAEWHIYKAEVEKPTIENTQFKYTGGLHTPTIKGFNSDFMTDNDSKTVRAAIDAGTYYIYIHLKDNENYRWKYGDSLPLPLTWRIHGIPAVKPYLNPKSFEYDGKPHLPSIFGLKTSYMTTSGDIEPKTVVGDYTITIKLSKNYEWSDDETNTPISLDWHITKVTVPVPSATDLEFIYDKSLHSPKLSNVNLNVISVNGTLSAVNADNYQITFKLKDSEHCEWNDGTANDIVIPWVIRKRQLPKPVGVVTEFKFNGGYHAPVIDNINMLYMEVKNAYKRIHAGVFNSSFRLYDTKNTEWEDGNTDTVFIQWVIDRKKVENPYLEPNEFVYDGENHTPEIINFRNQFMRVSLNSTRTAWDVREYYIYIYFEEYGSEYNEDFKTSVTGYFQDYEWEDGSYGILTLKWCIVPQKIKYPTGKILELVYNMMPQSPKIDGYISAAMGYNGTASAVDVGDYSVSFYLTDKKHYEWDDGVIENTPIDWSIVPAILDEDDFPYQRGKVTYNSHEQSPEWDNYSGLKLTVTGGNVGTNAGIYTTEFTPTENYLWANGSRLPVKIEWQIDKLGLPNPIQKNTLYYNGEEQFPEWDTGYNFVIVKVSGDVSGIDARYYDVVSECDGDNCYYSSNNRDICEAEWKINKKFLKIPHSRDYSYTGEEIVPEFIDYLPELMDISGDTSGTEVGNYTAYFTLKNKTNHRWEDAFGDNGKRRGASWRIYAPYIDLDVPYQISRLVYNGEKQSPIWANYDKNAMEIVGENPSEINAGEYVVYFRLKDGYKWRDGTTEGKKVKWKIEKLSVPTPYIKSVDNDGTGLYYYMLEGKRYPIWMNYNPNIMTLSGDTYDIDNTLHTTYFDLKDPNNYEWSTGLSDTYIVEWKLSEPFSPTVKPGTDDKKVHIPRQINAPYEDGTAKYPKWDRYNTTAIIELGGEWEGITAGERYVILVLNGGFVWEDGTYEIKAVPWQIFAVGDVEPEPLEPIVLHIPEQINIPYYDGYVKTPEWDEWDEYGIDIVSGDLYGVLAGGYPLILRPKSGHVWVDGTAEEKLVTWYINPGNIEEHKPDPTEPEKPPSEKEEETNDGGKCGCCCCPDTGLFDLLDNACAEDNFSCDCSNNSQENEI